MNKDVETQSTTQFNMSLATLMRIDSLLTFINKAKVVGTDALRLRCAIEGLYLELYPFLNEQEREEGEKMLREIVANVRVNENVIEYNTKLFGWIYEFEKWMRNKLNEKGLLMAKKDDPNSALGGG